MINDIILSLFDESGNALRPWAEAGFVGVAYDIINDCKKENFDNDGTIYYFNEDLSSERTVRSIFTNMRPSLVMSWSPCTDLTVAGAKHFAKKLEEDPDCQDRAVRMARHVETIANEFNVPWMAENPVGVLSTKWRKPDAYFHPYEYAGYLPEDDEHPRYPEIIPARDIYAKKTCIWHGNGFIMPERKEIVPESLDNPGWKKLGGKSERTKRIRSEGPRGFLKAVYLANRSHVLGRYKKTFMDS